MRISKRLFALTLAAVSSFVAGDAFAQSAADKATDAAIACLDIGDPAERLACLEAAAREIRATRIRPETAEEAAAAEAAGAPVIANEDATDEDLFGAEALPSTRRAKQKGRLEAKVVEFRVNPLKNITAVLENGQVWRQLSGDRTVVRLPKADRAYSVTIKKGGLGNYWMEINELGRWIRVRRIK